MAEFIFYRTFYPELEKDTPVTVGFESVNRYLLDRIRGFTRVWMHSGNWWNLKPEERTPTRIIKSLKRLMKVCNVSGLMGLNIPPRYHSEYYDIWNYPKEVRYRALKRSLELTIELRELLDVDIPLYCCFEVGRLDDALEWYERALEEGFERLGAGFAGFLKGRPLPGAYEHIVEVIIASKAVGGEKVEFHASGIGSLKLLALIYYIGATSADGSTPIRAALANRTVYNLEGRGFRVDELKSWYCDCSFCREKKPEEILKLFKKSYSVRVVHNSTVWNEFIERMTRAREEGVYEEFLSKVLKGRIYPRILRYARDLLKKFNLY